MLQERAEVIFAESGITDDAAPKARFLQSSDGVLVVDTRDARHVLRGDLHFADDRSLQKVIADG